MEKTDFISTYYPVAKKAERETGVPALFALAQSALESGWGKHTPRNMMFGMKIGSGRNFGGWDGDRQLITTHEYSSKPNLSYPHIYPGYPIPSTGGKWKYKIKDYFRAYPTPLHAFKDWAGLLTGASRYANATNYTKQPYRFAEEVAAAGYATSPTYAEKVKRVMREIERILPTVKADKKMWGTILPIGGLLLCAGLIWAALRSRQKLKTSQL